MKDFEELKQRVGAVIDSDKDIGKQIQEATSVLPHKPTKRQQLEYKKKAFEEGVRRIDAALRALDKNPEFEKLLNVLNDAE